MPTAESYKKYMGLRSILTGTSPDMTPYIPYNPDSGIITIGKFRVQEYISPHIMKNYIERLSNQVNLRGFDEVLVNMNGGEFLFNWLARLQNYKYKPTKIEYHRPPKGYSANIVKAVPKELLSSNALVVDDIYDSGGVLSTIMQEVSPSSQAVVLITKNGIPNQIQVRNITIGLKIDQKWVGGCGMNLSVPGEKNEFRNYPGLVVKIGD